MAIEIKGFITSTLLDWEENIAAEIFLAGCNFRCPYCHAKELVLNPNKLNNIDKTDVINYLNSHKKWVDGLVICGGEPTIYQDFPDFIKEFKANGVKIKLDTNGSNPTMLDELIKDGLLDYVAMDIKAPLNQKQYSNIVRSEIDINDVINSVHILMSSSIDYEFRTTVVKELLSFDDLRNIGKFIQGAKRYRLQKFVKREGEILDNSLIDENYKEDEFKQICEELKVYVKDCKYR